MLARFRNQPLVDFQSARPRKNCDLRFVLSHLPLHGVGLQIAHIGRIADNEIEFFGDVEIREQIALPKMNPLGQIQAFRVQPGDFQCFGGNIRGFNLCTRQLVRQSQRDASRAGTDICNAQRFRGALRFHQLQDQLHRVLSLRPRDQHRRSHNEIQSPKFLMAGDVLRRLAASPLGNHALVSLRFVRAQFALRMRIQICTITPQREHQQSFSIQTRRTDVMPFQVFDCRVECGFQVHRRYFTTGA